MKFELTEQTREATMPTRPGSEGDQAIFCSRAVATGDGHIHACRAFGQILVVDAGHNDDGVVGLCHMDSVKEASEAVSRLRPSLGSLLFSELTYKSMVHSQPNRRERPTLE